MALSELSNDKAPGPDGFNVFYIKQFRSELKGRVLESFSKFWDGENLPAGFNSSFLVLVPKVPILKLIQDYRPISLIKSVAKLLTKTIANRLGSLVDKLIDSHQFGFVKGR